MWLTDIEWTGLQYGRCEKDKKTYKESYNLQRIWAAEEGSNSWRRGGLYLSRAPQEVEELLHQRDHGQNCERPIEQQPFTT